MSIRIEITGENTQEIAQSILQMAFMIAPRLAAPQAAPAEAVVAETVQPAKKPGRAKKGEAATIEHDESEVKTDVHAVTVSEQSVDAAAQSGGDASTEAASVSVGDAAGATQDNEAAAKVDAVAESLMDDEKPAPKDVVDPIRQHVINDYLNVVTESLPVRKDLYKALLDQFGVPAITALRPSQVAEFVAVVDAKIAGALAAK